MGRISCLTTAAHDTLALLFVLTAVVAGVVSWNSTDGVFYADVETSRGSGTVPKFGLAWWERAAISSVAGAVVGAVVAGAACVAARAAGGIAGIVAAGGRVGSIGRHRGRR